MSMFNIDLAHFSIVNFYIMSFAPCFIHKLYQAFPLEPSSYYSII